MEEKEKRKDICFPVDTPEERAVAILILDRIINEYEEKLDRGVRPDID